LAARKEIEDQWKERLKGKGHEREYSGESSRPSEFCFEEVLRDVVEVLAWG
jgi:hypothetical protein